MVRRVVKLDSRFREVGGEGGRKSWSLSFSCKLQSWSLVANNMTEESKKQGYCMQQ